MEYLTAHIIAAAETHGKDSEPAHEVGDLRQALRVFSMYIPPMHCDAIRKELEDALTWAPEETT